MECEGQGPAPQVLARWWSTPQGRCRSSSLHLPWEALGHSDAVPPQVITLSLSPSPTQLVPSPALGEALKNIGGALPTETDMGFKRSELHLSGPPFPQFNHGPTGI